MCIPTNFGDWDREPRINLRGLGIMKKADNGTTMETVPSTFAVTAGSNGITLRTLDKPTVLIQPNGDTRPLLLGVRGLTFDAVKENHRA
jgi:hypothetical protein